MSASCDLCKASSLEQVYAARNSGGKRTVWLCTYCGLLQSLPRSRKRVETPPASHRKRLRADTTLATLKPFLLKNKPLRVLDVGAGHGAFALELKGAHPKANIIGIEPDARAVGAWAGKPGFTWLNARVEDTRLEAEGFDLIHSCHTLQHLKSAREALLAHRSALAPGGYLFLEVPNIAMLSARDIVDEFFRDEHLYHFSARTLSRLLISCGFRTIAIANPRDAANITVVAVNGHATASEIPSDPHEVEAATALISAYHAVRLNNLAALAHVARAIDAMAPRKVAVWGAGRLLNNLIANGGLRPQSLTAIIDKHVAHFGTQAHGIRVSLPKDLARINPDVVVVMSRSLSNDIRDEAQTHVPGCEVVAYADLLAKAEAHAA
ncbi:MAG: class I SAM-dependent methyltransferase [Micropepsaceae bacterium]